MAMPLKTLGNHPAPRCFIAFFFFNYTFEMRMVLKVGTEDGSQSKLA